jgi:hypothetical protein
MAKVDANNFLISLSAYQNALINQNMFHTNAAFFPSFTLMCCSMRHTKVLGVSLVVI